MLRLIDISDWPSCYGGREQGSLPCDCEECPGANEMDCAIAPDADRIIPAPRVIGTSPEPGWETGVVAAVAILAFAYLMKDYA